MRLIEQTDAQLVYDLCAGDEAALGRIIDRYTAYVSAIARNIARDQLGEADIKEITADAFFTLWKTSQTAPPRNLRGYLARIARSRAIDALRRQRRELPLEDDAVEIPEDGPETDAVLQAEYAALHDAVDGLPEPDRSIFLRHYFLYQSVSVIADEMQLNVNTVKTKLRRGRERLRRELMEGGYFIE